MLRLPCPGFLVSSLPLGRALLIVSLAGLPGFASLTRAEPPPSSSAVTPADSTTPKKKGGARKKAAQKAQPVVAIPAADAPSTESADSPANPFERLEAPQPSGRIDEIVFSRLKELGIEPAHVCSDVVFVRRVYLDVIGTLPTAREVRQFLDDQSPGKRQALIDRLLERDEFADYWTMKWCDLLRVKAEFPINLWPNAAQAYHRWVFTAVRGNMPYDQFARALLTSNGSNFRLGPVNFFRASQARDAQGLARTTALTLMGARAEKWPTGRLAEMAPFFSAVGYKGTQEWKEEIVYFDPSKIPATGVSATFPDGTTTRLSADRDPREVFANWLIRPDNPWFARAGVNRVWSWLLGRGIVQEPDDLRADNPPSNPALLEYLEKQFVADRYDFKELFRLILNSQTYQLSSLSRSDRPEAEANFAFYPLRRLDAEVLIDALNQITGTTEKYSSPIPEPFTFIPEKQRSIALPDGSITSSFLEMFGRPSRDTGEEAERNNRMTATQRLHLLNSTHVQQKIAQGSGLQTIIRSRRAPRDILTELYVTILSRPPTEAERNAIGDYASTTTPGAATDVAWALINSTEFLYRH